MSWSKNLNELGFFGTLFPKRFEGNRTTLGGTACLSVTPAYGTDQDPEGWSQRSRTNRLEIPPRVRPLEWCGDQREGESVRRMGSKFYYHGVSTVCKKKKKNLKLIENKGRFERINLNYNIPEHYFWDSGCSRQKILVRGSIYLI